MNVFLGFYIPNEMLVPLWDLDSDYYLHNRISRPPTPYINRILYEENRINIESLKAGRATGSVAVQTPEWSLRQEGLARKYFVNSRSVLCPDPLHGREDQSLRITSNPSILLKSDYPLLFHDEDHEGEHRQGEHRQGGHREELLPSPPSDEVERAEEGAGGSEKEKQGRLFVTIAKPVYCCHYFAASFLIIPIVTVHSALH